MNIYEVEEESTVFIKTCTNLTTVLEKFRDKPTLSSNTNLIEDCSKPIYIINFILINVFYFSHSTMCFHALLQ